jgi:hypothetical protein
VKVQTFEYLINAGSFGASRDWERIKEEVLTAIKRIQWPPNSGKFTLYDQAGKRRGEGNGVKPIKDACMLHLKSLGWDLETRVDIATVAQPGPVDATCNVGGKLFCVEWETGNISSTHRALNKMALGMLKEILVGGGAHADLYVCAPFSASAAEQRVRHRHGKSTSPPLMRSHRGRDHQAGIDLGNGKAWTDNGGCPQEPLGARTICDESGV